MQRLIFEYSPLYFLLCLAAGGVYAYLLYGSTHSWSRSWNRMLFGLRMILVTTLLILLLGPILKQTENIFDKPTFVFLMDDSQSVRETANTRLTNNEIAKTLKTLKEDDRNLELSDLGGGVTDTIQFNRSTSDISSALRETINRYEGKNLAGIILISDGIYNNGVSPLYMPMRIPVFTVGVGDTTERADVVLKNVAYNRIVYQGNKFPLRAEVGISGLQNQDITVSVSQQGKVLQVLKKNSGSRPLLDFDFQLEAVSQGMQRLEVQIENVPKESNLKNNRTSAFVEVVEGKKKILLISPSPHPDMKAIREVIEKNSNYECVVNIPGVVAGDQTFLEPGKADLVIAMQGPDTDGKTTTLITTLIKSKTSALIILGSKTNLRMLSTAGIPITFENFSQRDEVQAVLNPDFKDFGFSDNMNTQIARYPPVQIPFGKFSFPATVKTILHQRIGNLVTDRPLLFTMETDQQKMAVLMGEGIWKWRLNEFRETEKTVVFDELFSKLLQFLSTRDDRRKFRCFPLQQEFVSDFPVVMESQVYNDLFEPVYGNAVDLELRDEQGKLIRYHYVIGQGSTRYQIGGLKEGVYHYRASTEIKGKKEEAQGQFLVADRNQESQNLTADFGLLRKLAENTGGKFYKVSDLKRLTDDISRAEVKSVIHTEESFNPLINLKAVFFILLTLISLEWFLRKYFGSY